MLSSVFRSLLAAFAVGFFAGGPAAHADGVETRLRAAIDGAHRPDKNRARDVYRHPFETLMFFGIRPDMTVVEIYPGSGWYTEILAPFLKGSGKLYAASWDKGAIADNLMKALERYHAKLKADPAVYGEVIVTELSHRKTQIAPAGSADMVLTFRNVHNWMKRGFDRQVFDAMYAALRPGGILGVVEHRADPDAWPDPQALSGYVHEDQVIQLAERAGFRLVAKSELNANPKDTRNHPEGVWTLPPTLRLKDRDREKYLAIGESDRMTLKFEKPEK